MVILYPGELVAQTAAGTQGDEPLRFDVSPIVGYRTGMTFLTAQNGQNPGPGLVLDGKPSYGMAVGFRLDEENLVEFHWSRQSTRLHLDDGTSTSNTKALLDQFHGDFTHEYILDEWPGWARPFVMASIGVTHVGGETSSSFSRFSLGLGGGVKVYFNRHLGWRFQGQWLPVVVNPQVDVKCAGGCIVHLTNALVSQAEFAVGPVFRF